jgi:5-formaminoimidazole-4-carboxamide-1-beta-D-ribofuranosyl 5'-monophosphate synthetase
MRKPYRYWSDKENCKYETFKYQTISSFSKNCNRGYQIARKNKWLDEICSHMLRIGIINVSTLMNLQIIRYMLD